MYSNVLPPIPRKIPSMPRKKKIRSVGEGGSSIRVSKVGRPRNKQSVNDLEDVDVVQRVLVRDEGADGSKGDGGPRGASGSTGRGASGSSSASGSRGRGAGGSKKKHVSSAGTQKRQAKKKKVGTFGFAKWFGLQDEDQVQTQDEDQVQTQDELVQTQDEDQVEQTQEQAEIDLTQVEQTQEQTQDQVQPQEQPQQVTLSTPSARILQRKLEKQGSSQKIALNVDV
uniref:Uncharacterized protein n=1 Tax=Tanacetum cinerariifolium TaxID=118510 RepID=A0A699Q7J5_TANCI|nr:hypothetical protein [Tanacetum cinerariifolium]